MGWAAGFGNHPGSIIIRTTNGGLNWNFQSQCQDATPEYIYFIDQNTGWVVGQIRLIVKTTDGGFNWSNQCDTISVHPLSGFFVDQNYGWVVGDGWLKPSNIISTTNGGNNWNYQNSPTSGILWSVYFVDVNTGWTVGEHGVILKTTNGGKPIGIKPISNEIPKTFSLSQNYPNPFNPSTKIKFSIPLPGGVSEGRGGLVTLQIFDILGREVATLVNEKLAPGTYEVEFDGSNYTSGVYFYRFEARDFSETKKLVLLK